MTQPLFFKKSIYFGLCVWAFCQPWSIAGSGLGIVLAAGGVLGYGISSRSFPSLRSPLEKPLWIYLLVGGLTAIFGIDWRHSLGQLGKDGQIILDFYIFSAAFALEGSGAILGFLAGGFIISALMGVEQVAGFFAPAALKNLLFQCAASAKLWAFLAPTARAHGAMYAVTYGELLGLGILGGFCFCVSRPRAKAGLSWLRSRIPFAVFCFIVIVGQILSGTRGAWLGTMAGIFLIAALEFSWESAAAAAAAAAAFVVGVFFNPRFIFGEAGVKAFNPGETSFFYHRQLWKVGWKMFLDHPLLGVGARNFGELSCRYNPALFCAQLWDQVDNFYLNQLAERGIIGFAAMALLFGTMIYQAWRRYRRSRSVLSLWFLSWIFALLFMSLTECAWRRAMIWTPTIALYCWMEREDKSGAAG